MTGTERDAIGDLRLEWVAFRDETRDNAESLAKELRAYRETLAPAIALAANLETASHAAAGAAGFIKWGAGIGASAVTIIGGLKLMGVL